MVKKLLCEICKAKTIEDILSYKKQISSIYSSLVDGLMDKSFSKTNYEDIKMLYDLNNPMMAYFGPSFYKRCGIPFFKKYNKRTLDIIELIVLFYSLLICEFIETDERDYWEDEILPNLFYDNERPLFLQLWSCFREIITIQKDEREIFIWDELECREVWLFDEHYEEILNLSLNKYKNSRYSCIINDILGIYQIRFTDIKYISEYQKIFVEVAYQYLQAITLPEYESNAFCDEDII
ncbi:MAG: hypothetical protein HXK71_01220 [Clostridiales bacterium]|nr:hypothetical protein [Clostridiales bacterium]